MIEKKSGRSLWTGFWEYYTVIKQEERTDYSREAGSGGKLAGSKAEFIPSSRAAIKRDHTGTLS